MYSEIIQVPTVVPTCKLQYAARWLYMYMHIAPSDTDTDTTCCGIFFPPKKTNFIKR